MNASLEQLAAWMLAVEAEHLEFKEAKSAFDATKLVEYCAALANEGGGTLVLGVTDKRPRNVVGSRAFQDLEATKQKLCDRLRMRIDAEELTHPDGRVVIFSVPGRPIGMLLVEDRVTYAALILLGKRKALGTHLANAEVIFEYRADDASIAYQQRKEYREGFLLFDDELWETINLRNTVFSYQDGLFRQEMPAFNEQAVREAVLNAVSHRDYRLGGSTFVKQSPHRIQIDSPGGFPAGVTADNILLRQSPRNRRLADALARCGLVERSGQGADRMFSSAVREGKLPPDFSASDDFQVSVVLHGQVQDERFLGFMERLGREAQRALSLDDLIALDAVHRELPLPDRVGARIPVLIAMGALERVGRKLLLSRRFYASVGKSGEYTRRRGLDRGASKALLLQHIEASATEGSPLAELNQVLPSLKPTQVQNLLRDLKREGRAHPVGRTKAARWFPGPPPGAQP